MNFPATDIEYSMQDEIDRLKARIEELEAENARWQSEMIAQQHDYAEAIDALEAERDRLREALTVKDFPPVGAAFINAISEEGTKDEAVEWLAKQWNETCFLRAAIRAALDGGKP
jgi:TolA-binding protein